MSDILELSLGTRFCAHCMETIGVAIGEKCHLKVAHAVVQWEGREVGPRQVDRARRVGMLDEPLQSEIEVGALRHQTSFPLKKVLIAGQIFSDAVPS